MIYHREYVELFTFTVATFQEFVKTVVHSKAQQESVIRSKKEKFVQQSPSFTRCGTQEKKEKVQLVICYVGFLIKLDSCVLIQSNCSCVQQCKALTSYFDSIPVRAAILILNMSVVRKKRLSQ